MDDPRLTPARPEIAARHLEGRITADRFVDGEEREVIDAVAPLQREPTPNAMLDTQALRGERVTVYDHSAEGWAWCQLKSDGYVGWIPDRALARPGAAPTHKVVALRTFAFPGPSIKLPPVQTLPLGAALTVRRHDGVFAVAAGDLYVPAVHIAPLDHTAGDFVAVAEMFAGTPYLWGGKTSLGIDCSGLVQVALNASGIACPRDSYMQEAALDHDDFGSNRSKIMNVIDSNSLERDAGGKPLRTFPHPALGRTLSAAEAEQPRRGDLIFWKGHVAIVRDSSTLIHANAHHMATAVEAIRDAIARIKAAGSDVTSVKRLG